MITSPVVLSMIPWKLLSSVSVNTNDPATNATPSTMANALMASRSLRASRLRTVTRNISGHLVGRRLETAELLHLLQDVMGRRGAQLADHPAVAEEHHRSV